MLTIKRNIFTTDKLYTKKEFLELLEKNKYQYIFEPGEAHYANKDHIFTTHIGLHGNAIEDFAENNPNATHIAILETPEI